MTDERTWPRPVPTVGDASAASERRDQPAGWAFPPEARHALYDVIAARRDVRRFRPDEVPGEVLRRILAAAHAGPSVGHSQPWRFVLVTDPGTRDSAALLADRERLRQAAGMPPDRARRLLDLQLEGVREAPLGIVVACDRRVESSGVLGRATFPDTDLWSCACAIENLWLAARAEGLGVGWVTFFEPADLAALLGLPAGVETLGWLCVGWPDERPPAPGLERAGWSARTALEDVLLSERWPGDEVPAPVQHLRGPDQEQVVEVRDRADVQLTPPGSLGVLDRSVDRLLATDPESDGVAGTLVLVAADHPVTVHGVSTYPTSVTTHVLTATVAGRSVGATAAAAAGLQVVAVDARAGGAPVLGTVRVEVAGHVGDLLTTDALERDTARDLVAAGRRLGSEIADGPHGQVVALGEVGVGNTTVAAALTAALLGRSAAEVVGLGSGADSEVLASKARVIEGALDRVASRIDPQDPIGTLAALGGAAVLAGVVIGAAKHGRVIILDGLLTSAAALVAVRCHPSVARFLVAGQRSRELAHGLVLAELGLEPLLDLRIRSGEGVGACLAASLLRQGTQIRLRSARVDR